MGAQQSKESDDEDIVHTASSFDIAKNSTFSLDVDNEGEDGVELGQLASSPGILSDEEAEGIERFFKV